jgi:hypothetical protein
VCLVAGQNCVPSQLPTRDVDTPLQQLVVATFGRSQDTYRGILSPLLDGLPTQAAMLARSLFEDLVVGHWLVLNADDPDWLIQRF